MPNYYHLSTPQGGDWEYGWSLEHLQWLLLVLAKPCSGRHTNVIDGGPCWPRRLTDAPVGRPPDDETDYGKANSIRDKEQTQ
jgi:hypothetical protein